jgi:hypothetical protein
MARFWRRPGTLMTAYVVLFLAAGPWGDVSHASSHSPLWQAPGAPALVAAFLAWRVTRGGWFSRGLIILYTVLGAFSLINSGSMRSGSLASFGFLGIYAIQIGLLLSTPIYNRTRRTDDRDQAPVSRLWVPPPGWLLAAGAVIGLAVTLLYLGRESSEAVPGCTSTGTGPAASAASCTTLAEGYPVHFLSTAPFLSLDPGKTVKVADISVFADPVIYKGAFALDFATWAVVSFLALYMLWLPSRRTAMSAVSRPQPI